MDQQQAPTPMSIKEETIDMLVEPDSVPIAQTSISEQQTKPATPSEQCLPPPATPTANIPANSQPAVSITSTAGIQSTEPTVENPAPASTTHVEKMLQVFQQFASQQGNQQGN